MHRGSRRASGKQRPKGTFSHYDKDRSGSLEKDECIDCLRGVLNGIDDDKIATLIDHMDTDKSETLSVDEITQFLVGAHETRHPQSTGLALAAKNAKGY